MTDASFIPHAIVETANWPPTSLLTIWALGAANLKRIDFDLIQPESTFIDQALAGLRLKLDRWGGKELPSFGRPISIIINLAPQKAIRIGLDGAVKDYLDWNMEIGKATIANHSGKVALNIG